MNNLNESLLRLFSIPSLIPLFLLWVLFWKGWGLWRAAQKKQLTWFVILLVVNTMGLLEIAYLFYLNKWDLGSEKLLKFIQARLVKKK